jgi:hypothetical protein
LLIEFIEEELEEFEQIIDNIKDLPTGGLFSFPRSLRFPKHSSHIQLKTTKTNIHQRSFMKLQRDT